MRALTLAWALLAGCVDVWTSGSDLDLRDLDGDGVVAGLDCDDRDRGVGADRYWRDGDGDGFGAENGGLGCARPADTPSVDNGDDCDDGHYDVSPTTLWYADGDGDGWLAEGAAAVQQCEDPDGGDRSALPQYWLPVNTTGSSEYDALGDRDCDDADPGLNPETEWTPDADGDGYGDMRPSADVVRTQCRQPLGYFRLDQADDCDDGDELTTPESTWYRDADLDGYGESEDWVQSCEAPEGYTASLGGDCDDDKADFALSCPFVEVSPRSDGVCARRSDGEVLCWSASGLLEDPGDVELVALAGVGETSCGLDADGAPRCWGADGGLDDLSALGDGYEAIAVIDYIPFAAVPIYPALRLLRGGELSTFADGALRDIGPEGDDYLSVGGEVYFRKGCALRGEPGRAQATCWGDATLIADAPTEEGLIALEMGTSGACALLADGALRCWGDAQDSLNVDMPREAGFVDLRVREGACALAGDGAVRCWGGAPTPPEEVLDARAIGLGEGTACAVLSDGGVRCWGALTAAPPTGYALLGLGPAHACAAQAGRLGCWGAASPELRLSGFQALADSADLCALSAEGEAWCFTSEGERISVPDTDASGAPLRFASLDLSQSGAKCGLTVDGEVTCWEGWDEDRDGALPSGGGWVVLSVAAGSGESGAPLCAVHESGALSCAGWSLTPLPSGSDFIDVEVIGFDICALHEGGVIECVESEFYGYPLFDASEGGFVEVFSDGQEHVCGLRSDGLVSCRTIFDFSLSFWAPDVVDVAVNGPRGCVLSASGEVRCAASFGYDIPLPPEGLRFVDIAANIRGGYCGLTEIGDLRCWGEGFEHDLPPRDQVEQLSLGAQHTCALVQGVAVCDGPSALQTPTFGSSFTALASGELHVCGLDADGGVRCWGDDLFGQASPPAELSAQSLYAGGDTTCAIDAQGAWSCWGLLEDTPSGRFVRAAVGAEHACALSAEGEAVCVGDDSYGQLTPPEGARFFAIAAGDWHTCGLVDAGDDSGLGLPLCWGLDIGRQVRGAPEARFVSLYASGDQTCGVGQDGLPLCWGRALYGQCPDPPLMADLGTCEA